MEHAMMVGCEGFLPSKVKDAEIWLCQSVSCRAGPNCIGTGEVSADLSRHRESPEGALGGHAACP